MVFAYASEPETAKSVTRVTLSAVHNMRVILFLTAFLFFNVLCRTRLRLGILL